MRKQSSMSTANTFEARNGGPTSQKDEITDGENRSSPIRWGFLAAFLAHIVNTIATAFGASHPWVCLHGSVNLALAIVLGFISFFWNLRYDTDLYVRRELFRFSIAVMVTMAGLAFGHAALTSAFHSLEEGESETDFGSMQRMHWYIIILYSVLFALWSIFGYIQFVALRNLESANLQAPRTTTVDQEIQNSVAAGNHQRHIPNCRNHRGLYFYGFTLLSALCLWYSGLKYLGTLTWASVGAVLSATLMLCGVVSLGVRSNVWAVSAQGVCGLLSVVEFILGLANGEGQRVWRAISVLIFQVLGLAAAAWRMRGHREVDRSAHQAAPEHFFRRNGEVPTENADPMSVFMAGVAKKEDQSSVV